MAMMDPLADMLTRLRNANKARFEKVDIPSSRLKVNIAKILREEGYIKDYKVIDDKKQGTLRIFLKYDGKKNAIITGLRRVSKPGLRNYSKAKGIVSVKSGTGLAILTTSRGVIADKEARKLNVGGEVLCLVW
jgi:small subunit ribosomal protein S8